MKEININRTRSEIPSLAIVVPCYNEKDAFPYCVEGLATVLKNLLAKEKIARNSYILFVDDGSKDNTWDDISCIEKMIDKYNEGFEIVYGVRDNRSSDSVFKRTTANKFYSLMSRLGVNQVPNHADFRLLSRTALTALKDFKEQNLYLRGLIPLLGYKSTRVYYSRDERVAGESKYPLKKMVALALEGITSLTITPLRMIAATGITTCLLSTIAAIYALIEKIQGVIATLYLAAIFLVYSPTIIFSYAFSDDWSTLSDVFSGKGSPFQWDMQSGRPLYAIARRLAFTLVHNIDDLAYLRFFTIITVFIFCLFLFLFIEKRNIFKRNITTITFPLLICLAPAIQVYNSWATCFPLRH